MDRKWTSRICTILLGIACVSCFSKGIDDLRRDGDGEVKRLIKTLQGVESRDDLVLARRAVEERMERLVGIMIEIDKAKKGGSTGSAHEDRVLGGVLQRELERIYAIDGCRELMEAYEQGALHRLDAYDRRSRDSKWSR